MSAFEDCRTHDPDPFGPVVDGPDEGRLRELRGNMNATVFCFRESPILRSGWDRSDLLAIITVMRRTRTVWRLDPAMGDMELAEALRGQPDLAAASPLSHTERFSRATYDYHELCVRIFGEYPHGLDPRAWPPEWRYALAAYAFFLRLKDASVRLDRMSEARAASFRTFETLFGEYARTVAQCASGAVAPVTDKVLAFPDPETVKRSVYDAAIGALAAE